MVVHQNRKGEREVHSNFVPNALTKLWSLPNFLWLLIKNAVKEMNNIDKNVSDFENCIYLNHYIPCYWHLYHAWWDVHMFLLCLNDSWFSQTI